MDRDSFIFYRSFYEALEDLPSKNQLEVYKAIANYSLNFSEINLSGLSKTIFTLIKPQLDANNQRFKNGSKGGRPNQTETETKPKNNQTETKTKANKNVNVNVNDNKNVNDNVNIVYPFESETFFKFWDLWKDYKKNEHRFTYKTTLSEQAALKQLGEISNQDETTAIKIIETSIANGYKGLFTLKNNANGNDTRSSKTVAEALRNAYTRKD